MLVNNKLAAKVRSVVYMHNSHNNFSSHITNCRRLRILGTSASFLFFILSALFIHPIVLKLVDAEATNRTPVVSTTTLSMTVDHTSASLNLTPTSPTGTFSSSSSTDSASFDITTNNYTGYNLSIISSNDAGELTNTDTTITSNNTLSSISSPTTKDTFSSSSNTQFNNKWGYQPSTYYDTANHTTIDNTNPATSVFLPSPTTTPTTLDVTTAANSTSSGDPITPSTPITDLTPNNYTIGLGARIDYTKPTGTYNIPSSLQP